MSWVLRGLIAGSSGGRRFLMRAFDARRKFDDLGTAGVGGGSGDDGMVPTTMLQTRKETK